MAENRERKSGQNNNRRSDRSRSYYRKPKYCQFCSDKSIEINYKNTDVLRRFVTEEGKIRARRQTGACAKHQRALAGEIKKARHIALLPFIGGTSQKSYR